MTTVQTRSRRSNTKNPKNSKTTKPSAIKVEPTRLRGTDNKTVPEFNTEEFPILPPTMRQPSFSSEHNSINTNEQKSFQDQSLLVVEPVPLTELEDQVISPDD